jgi:DNA-directed RNA polymerase II subunit RPB2
MNTFTQEFEEKLRVNTPKELGVFPSSSTNLDVWSVLDLYFKERGLVYHKLEPYDLFLETVKEVIQRTPPITVEDRKSQNNYQYTFGNVSIFPPSFTPQEARLNNLYYNLTITADIIQGFTSEMKSHTQKTFHQQKICELPLMLGTRFCHTYQKTEEEKIHLGECDSDIGGYYICHGKERCIVASERIEYNRIYVWPPQKPKEKKNFLMMAEIRSVVVRGSKPSLVKIFIEPSHNMVCTLSGLKEVVQIGTIIHAVGFACGMWGLNDDSTSVIRSLIIGDDISIEMSDMVEVLLENSKQARNDKCIDIISYMAMTAVPKANRPEFIQQICRKELLLHLPDRLKPYFLCYMVRKLMMVRLKKRTEDDRDHFANKRCDSDGKLLEDLFRGYFIKYLESVTKKLMSHPNNVSIFERDFTITQGIQRCMGTGNWGIQKIGFQKVGVCQLLTRLNYVSALSHLRRVCSNRSVESRAMKIRHLHSSQWGVFDPAETPEGENAGILKNMSVGGHITSETSPFVVETVLNTFKSFDPKIEVNNFHLPKVFVNGNLLGLTKSPGYLLGELREARTNGRLHPETSIAYKSADKEIHIYCDSGRCSRPLFTIKADKLLIPPDFTVSSPTWHTLIEKGYIQYVDTLEEQTSFVSTFTNNILKGSNFCEIHPATILGVCCSIIPFCNHNQSPRNAYSGNMTKQAIGIFAMNFLQRFETSGYILHYPEKPLVVPRMAKYFGYEKLASGINCIVACISEGGWGQEDSVIINLSAVQRGLFTTTVYKTYTAEEKNQENQMIETIELPPDPKIGGKNKNILKLDDRGIIKEKSIVKEGDVIIYKTIRKDGKSGERSDTSIIHKLEETGFVDKVLVTKNADGNKLVKVRVGFIRIPIMGDKFASTHAQKGTCGILLPQEDLPFTAEGIVPDLIINPHAIPSRMTIAHLIECITGKVAVLKGEIIDGTPFDSDQNRMVKHMEELGSVLHQHGYDRTGEETMYSGITGDLLKGTIFIGPTYYRRLKHMIMDKLSARAEGPVQGFTRQPANHGRKNGTKYTSTRFGNMEVDGILSHGARDATRERMFVSSDAYQTEVCFKCGGFTAGQTCKCQAGSGQVAMPYAYKLFQHNTTSLMIKSSLRTEDSTSTKFS